MVHEFGLLALAILFASGLLCCFFNLFNVAKLSSMISCCLLASCLFGEEYNWKTEWFTIGDISFDLSWAFNEIGILICLVILSILCCLYLSRSIEAIDKSINRKFGVLNLFVFFMCCAVLTTSLFQFYVSIEAMGIISASLVGIEKNSEQQTTKVFLFNKLASLLFLLAIVMIAIEMKSFEFSDLKNMCNGKECGRLLVPATLLFVSVLCKGAQMPFSYWLIDAVKANIFASILIHAGTIVGVGIIFITKCYFLFDCFPILQKTMIGIGMFTAVWLACCALVHNNIKKVIACLTASSAGIMYTSCGMGMYSLALLYFVCHAFFKAMVFLSYAYLIAAAFGERNVLRLGGLKEYAPRVSDVVWISFLAAVGFPFLPGFFAKIAFMDSAQTFGMTLIIVSNVAVNILATAALFRLILLSMYGKAKADDATLSRVSNSNSFDVKPVWILIGCSIFGAFVAWSWYEYNVLHFGSSGTIRIRNVFDYFFENIKEVAQIAASVLLVLCFAKAYNSGVIKFRGKILNFVVLTFRRNKIHECVCNFVKYFTLRNMKIVNAMNNKFVYLATDGLSTALCCATKYMNRKYRSKLQAHVVWIIFGLFLLGCFAMIH